MLARLLRHLPRLWMGSRRTSSTGVVLNNDSATVGGEISKALSLQASGHLREAQAGFQQMLVQHPDNADVLHLLGSNLISQGRHSDARPYLARALIFRPRDAILLHDCGIIAVALGQSDAAEVHFRHALSVNPNFAEAMVNYATMLKGVGRTNEALALYTNALRLRPDFAVAAYNFARLLTSEGRIAEAIAQFRHAINVIPSFVDAHSNYIYWLNFDPAIEPATVFNAHLEWARVHAEPLVATGATYTNSMQPERKLRIGYVSPNFKAHAAAYFLETTLACHDPTRFELFAFSDVKEADENTERIKQYFAHWRDCSNLTDGQLAAQVASDEVDILIDLTGHTQGNRLLMFARNSAPIQITWNGYANTTGMSVMDYRISDYLADPPGMTEHLHSEKLLRMPDVYMVFSPPVTSPEIGALPVLQSGEITLGSFNSITKITQEVIETWSRILVAMPNARLLIAAVPTASARERLASTFENCGVSSNRLILHSPLPRQKFLALHHQADFALDPFPFAGTTTTCDSLWMGLPVVTLAGATHAGRVGVSMLTNVGLPDLVASSRDEYVQVAVALAANIERLRELRSQLRQRMLTSPLMDAPRFTRHLEAAYREVWRNWCREPLANKTAS